MAERREYAYYEGCSLEGTAVAYNMSLKLVMKTLGVDLKEPTDWSCCGSTPAHAVNHNLAGALAARNLSIIERMGLSTVAVPCPSCLSALRKAHTRMSRNKVFREAVNSLLDTPYDCTVSAKSALQVIYEDIGLEEVARPVTTELPGMKVAPYYGCIFNRPPKIVNFDDPENPIAMDRILEAVGVEVVDYSYKLECCGAAFGLPKRDTVLSLTSKVLAMAVDVGATCIAVTCPLCQQNLDLRQAQVNAAMGTSFHIPILFFSQIMGLAYGYSPKELGLSKNVISADEVIGTRKPKAKVHGGEDAVPESNAAVGGASK
jgi:heterodisulfide reductase subunit B2